MREETCCKWENEFCHSSFLAGLYPKSVAETAKLVHNGELSLADGMERFPAPGSTGKAQTGKTTRARRTTNRNSKLKKNELEDEFKRVPHYYELEPINVDMNLIGQQSVNNMQATSSSLPSSSNLSSSQPSTSSSTSNAHVPHYWQLEPVDVELSPEEIQESTLPLVNKLQSLKEMQPADNENCAEWLQQVAIYSCTVAYNQTYLKSLEPRIIYIKKLLQELEFDEHVIQPIIMRARMEHPTGFEQLDEAVKRLHSNTEDIRNQTNPPALQHNQLQLPSNPSTSWQPTPEDLQQLQRYQPHSLPTSAPQPGLPVFSESFLAGQRGINNVYQYLTASLQSRLSSGGEVPAVQEAQSGGISQFLHTALQAHLLSACRQDQESRSEVSELQAFLAAPEVPEAQLAPEVQVKPKRIRKRANPCSQSSQEETVKPKRVRNRAKKPPVEPIAPQNYIVPLPENDMWILPMEPSDAPREVTAPQEPKYPPSLFQNTPKPKRIRNRAKKPPVEPILPQDHIVPLPEKNTWIPPMEPSDAPREAIAPQEPKYPPSLFQNTPKPKRNRPKREGPAKKRGRPKKTQKDVEETSLVPQEESFPSLLAALLHANGCQTEQEPIDLANSGPQMDPTESLLVLSEPPKEPKLVELLETESLFIEKPGEAEPIVDQKEGAEPMSDMNCKEAEPIFMDSEEAEHVVMKIEQPILIQEEDPALVETENPRVLEIQKTPMEMESEIVAPVEAEPNVITDPSSSKPKTLEMESEEVNVGVDLEKSDPIEMISVEMKLKVSQKVVSESIVVEDQQSQVAMGIEDPAVSSLEELELDEPTILETEVMGPDPENDDTVGTKSASMDQRQKYHMFVVDENLESEAIDTDDEELVVKQTAKVKSAVVESKEPNMHQENVDMPTTVVESSVMESEEVEMDQEVADLTITDQKEAESVFVDIWETEFAAIETEEPAVIEEPKETETISINQEEAVSSINDQEEADETKSVEIETVEVDSSVMDQEKAKPRINAEVEAECVGMTNLEMELGESETPEPGTKETEPAVIAIDESEPAVSGPQEMQSEPTMMDPDDDEPMIIEQEEGEAVAPESLEESEASESVGIETRKMESESAVLNSSEPRINEQEEMAAVATSTLEPELKVPKMMELSEGEAESLVTDPDEDEPRINYQDEIEDVALDTLEPDAEIPKMVELPGGGAGPLVMDLEEKDPIVMETEEIESTGIAAESTIVTYEKAESIITDSEEMDFDFMDQEDVVDKPEDPEPNAILTEKVEYEAVTIVEAEPILVIDQEVIESNHVDKEDIKSISVELEEAESDDIMDQEKAEPVLKESEEAELIIVLDEEAEPALNQPEEVEAVAIWSEELESSVVEVMEAEPNEIMDQENTEPVLNESEEPVIRMEEETEPAVNQNPEDPEDPEDPEEAVVTEPLPMSPIQRESKRYVFAESELHELCYKGFDDECDPHYWTGFHSPLQAEPEPMKSSDSSEPINRPMVPESTMETDMEVALRKEPESMETVFVMAEKMVEQVSLTVKLPEKTMEMAEMVEATVQEFMDPMEPMDPMVSETLVEESMDQWVIMEPETSEPTVSEEPIIVIDPMDDMVPPLMDPVQNSSMENVPSLVEPKDPIVSETLVEESMDQWVMMESEPTVSKESMIVIESMDDMVPPLMVPVQKSSMENVSNFVTKPIIDMESMVPAVMDLATPVMDQAEIDVMVNEPMVPKEHIFPPLMDMATPVMDTIPPVMDQSSSMVNVSNSVISNDPIVSMALINSMIPIVNGTPNGSSIPPVMDLPQNNSMVNPSGSVASNAPMVSMVPEQPNSSMINSSGIVIPKDFILSKAHIEALIQKLKEPMMPPPIMNNSTIFRVPEPEIIEDHSVAPQVVVQETRNHMVTCNHGSNCFQPKFQLMPPTDRLRLPDWTPAASSITNEAMAGIMAKVPIANYPSLLAMALERNGSSSTMAFKINGAKKRKTCHASEEAAMPHMVPMSSHGSIWAQPTGPAAKQRRTTRPRAQKKPEEPKPFDPKYNELLAIWRPCFDANRHRHQISNPAKSLLIPIDQFNVWTKNRNPAVQYMPNLSKFVDYVLGSFGFGEANRCSIAAPNFLYSLEWTHIMHGPRGVPVAPEFLLNPEFIERIQKEALEHASWEVAMNKELLTVLNTWPSARLDITLKIFCDAHYETNKKIVPASDSEKQAEYRLVMRCLNWASECWKRGFQFTVAELFSFILFNVHHSIGCCYPVGGFSTMLEIFRKYFPLGQLFNGNRANMLQ